MTPNIGFFAQSFTDWNVNTGSSRRIKASESLSLGASDSAARASKDGLSVSPEARLRNLLDRFRRDAAHHGSLEVSVPLSDRSEGDLEGFGTGDPKMEKDLDLLLRMIAGDEEEYQRLRSRFSDLMKAAKGVGNDAPEVAIASPASTPSSAAAEASTEIATTTAASVSVNAQSFTRVESSAGASIMVDAVTGRPIPMNEAMTRAVQDARETAEQTGATTASRSFAGGEVHLRFERINGRIEIQDLRFAAVQGKADPLVLDLAGDGIDLRSPGDGAVFDINADGKQDRTGWVKGDDALLVMDRNGNGTIDDGRELFGDQNGAANGFEELGKLDANKDGVIDRRDPLFSALKLYRDINTNGRIDKNEMIPLDAAGVVTISLSFLRKAQEQNGNTLLLNGSFTTADGRRGQVADVLFGYQ